MRFGMNEELYEMIFKRKSFHLFRNIGKEHITDAELEELENAFYKFQPLVDDIKVKIKVVKDLQPENISFVVFRESVKRSSKFIEIKEMQSLNISSVFNSLLI